MKPHLIVGISFIPQDDDNFPIGHIKCVKLLTKSIFFKAKLYSLPIPRSTELL